VVLVVVVVVVVVVVMMMMMMMMMVLISEFCMLQKASSLFIIDELTAECNIAQQATRTKTNVILKGCWPLPRQYKQ
jgi:hypothetical protein